MVASRTELSDSSKGQNEVEVHWKTQPVADACRQYGSERQRTGFEPRKAHYAENGKIRRFDLCPLIAPSITDFWATSVGGGGPCIEQVPPLRGLSPGLSTMAFKTILER